MHRVERRGGRARYPGGVGPGPGVADLLDHHLAHQVGRGPHPLADLGAAGEPWAVQMLADRFDGKPKQQTEVTGADGGPIETRAITLDFSGSRTVSAKT